MKRYYTIFITTIFIILFSSSNTYATDYYWKGGSGDFNDLNMWWLNSYNSGQTALQAPISTDNVYFTAAGFTVPGAVITVNSNANCDSMTWDDNITLANKPTLSGGNASVYLDIYGSIAFATNMTNNYNGNVRLKAAGTVESILTRGVRFRGRTIVLNGTADSEWHLLDDFNNSYSYTSAISGGIRLVNGKFFSNGHTMVVDRIFFYSNASQTTAVNLDGSDIYVRLEYRVNNNPNNYAPFSIVGTNVYLNGYPGRTTPVYATMGSNLVYENIYTNHLTYFYDGLTAANLYANENVSFYTNNVSANIDNFYAQPLKTYNLAGGNYKLNIENYFLTASCSNKPLFYAVNGADINKKTAGTLDIYNSILQGIGCDTTGGRVYNASNSIDAGGNSSNWDFGTITSRIMYFRPTINNKWHLAGNWEVWNGSTLIPNTGCPPTPNDDVYFDLLSFPGVNLYVEVDSSVFCRDMRWLTNVVDSASIDIKSGAILNCYGSAQLTANMKGIPDNMGRIRLSGHGPDTLYTAEVPIYAEIEVRPYAYYHIIGNYTGHYLEGQPRSRIHADGIQINAYSMRLDSGYFNNVYAHLTQNRTHTRFGGNYGTFLGGANMDYQGTTTFELSALHATSGSPILSLGQNEVMPNVIANNHISLGGYGRSLTVKGNLVLNDHLTVYWAAAHLKVLGTMSLYEGDLYCTAGKIYRFNGGSLVVNDTLHAIGTCTEYINFLAASTGFTVSLGGDDIQYSFITGWRNNNANPTINALNSIDGGNNNNVDFPISGTGVTYYWRADATDATDFEGDWNNPDHWTTNPADLTGTLGGCLPTLIDTVIFDNMSFSVASNGCTVSSGSYCKTIISTSNVELLGVSPLYVANSVWLDPTTMYNHTGDINFVGADTGYIDMDGILVQATLKFSNAGGVWFFVSDNVGTGGFFLYKGEVHTNGYYISKHGLSAASGTTLDIRNSHIDIPRNLPICCNTAWTVSNGAQVLAANSYIDLHPGVSYATTCAMGNHTYNDVRFYAGSYLLNVSGNANYSNVDAVTNCRFRGNNSFDSLTLHGNRFYYFDNGKTQTLNAPYGKIIIANDAGPGNFVNIETIPSGGTAYFHKEYGTAFCVDWVKIADNEGTKGAAPPAAWAANHQFLQFETGENSDNINNSATGIWAFDLPAILTVTSAHADTLDFCAGDTTVFVPITMAGTYPYSIVYTWTDIWGNTGIDTIIENDDDSDILTPHIYNLALNPWTTTDYTIDVAALRCGARNYGAPVKPLHLRLPKNPLVTTDRTGSCVLNNNSVWAHFVDDIDQKPMLSILDSTSITDNDALGLVNVQTNFDATVQSWNGKPYLPRHWKVDAANATGGHVRLYFTQQDLDKLGLETYNGLAPIVGSELILWKFDDTITVGVPAQIPFTVIPLTGRAADPFSSASAVYAIEFQVSSFSGFMLQVTDLGLFPLELLSFEAEAVDNKKVALNWATDKELNVSHFVLERSREGIKFDAIGQVEAGEQNTYQFMDENPFYGSNYYRLRIVDKDETFQYSEIRTAIIEGTNLVAIAPNPVTSGQLNLTVNTTLDGTIQLNVFDAIGQLAIQQKATIKAGQVNNLQLNVQELSSGIYTLQLIDSKGEVKSKQFRVK